jgi:hypothetical protein
MATFTDAPWSSPESNLSAEQYCSVCLVDQNPAGKPKTKANCHLPIRSKPGAPINKGALRAVASALQGGRGATLPGVDKKAVARKVVSMMKQAGMDPGKSMMNSAMS